MSTPPRTWITPEMVATYLGDPNLATDPNLELAVSGVAAYVESIRTDIFLAPYIAHPIQPPEPMPVPDEVVFGSVLWSAHVFQLRSAPGGFAGYGDGAGDAMADLSLASNRADIWRLIGLKRPVAY